MRIYLDNQLITYLLGYLQKKELQDQTRKETESLVFLLRRDDIEVLVSEESLAEIRKLNKNSLKRKNLEQLYFKLKQTRVIRNSSVKYDDEITTYNSMDVRYNHSYDDKDLNRVREFLKSRGNENDFDTKYIANAILPENKIDIFLTADKKTIWNYAEDIKRQFGLAVKTPTQLEEELKT